MKTDQGAADVFIDLRRGASAPPRRPSAGPGARHARRRSRGLDWLGLADVSIDGTYAFLFIAAALFVQQAGSLSGLAMAVLPLLYMALRRREALSILRQRWPLLLVPAFVLVSAVWSQAPGVSVKYGLEMWLTAAAGIGLASARRPTAVIKGLSLGFLLYLSASLVLGRSTALGVGAGGSAFVGLGDGKNQFADIAVTGALLSLAGGLIGLRQRRPLWAAFSLLAAAMEIYLMIQARSAGAMIAGAVGMVLLTGMLLLSLAPRYVRVGCLALMLASMAILATAIGDLTQLAIGSAADLFGKDATLTGRTYLWYRAHDLIEQHPWLGTGYYAFWRQGNTDAEGLWQYAGITGRSGFNFHNTLVELTVQLGYLGAAVFCLTGLVILVGLTRHFIARPTLTLCFWFTYFLCVLVRAGTEAVAYAPFFYATCFIFAAGGTALAPLPRRPRAAPRFAPQAVRLHPFYAAQNARRAPALAAPAAARRAG